jgi:hypothetical protein
MQRVRVDFNDLLTNEDVVVADLTTGYGNESVEVLHEGETVLLFEPDDFEVEATLWFDEPHRRWWGKVN